MSGQTCSVLVFSGSGAQGGAERQLANFINSLKAREIYLFCFGNTKYLHSQLRSELTVTFLSFAEICLLCYLLTFPSLKNRVDRNKLIINFLSLPRDCDVYIVGWLPKGNLLAYIVNIFARLRYQPHLCWFHRNSFFLCQSIYSQTLLMATLIISLFSPYRIRHFCNSYSIFNHWAIRMCLKDVEYYPNYFNKDYFCPTNYSSSKLYLDNLVGTPIKILYAARFSPEKGHLLFVEALKLVHYPIQVTFIGSGVDKLRKIIENIQHSNVSYLFNESAQDIASIYYNHHFTALFSLSESFPNVLVESMLMSTPCIVTDVGDIRRIVGEWGFVSPSRKLHDIRTVINYACSCIYDKEKYQLVRTSARNHALNLLSNSKKPNYLRNIV